MCSVAEDLIMQEEKVMQMRTNKKRLDENRECDLRSSCLWAIGMLPGEKNENV